MMFSSLVTHRATGHLSRVTAIGSIVISGMPPHIGMQFGGILWARVNAEMP